MALAVAASQTLTVSGQPANTETVTVGSKTYTFQTSLTNVDGNVLIGASASASLDNLKAAVNLAAGAGTTYATAMTAHPTVKATTKTATTLVFTALIRGAVGNHIPSTETLTNGSFGAATLASGTGSAYTDVRAQITGAQLNASAEQALRNLSDPDGTGA